MIALSCFHFILVCSSQNAYFSSSFSFSAKMCSGQPCYIATPTDWNNDVYTIIEDEKNYHETISLLRRSLTARIRFATVSRSFRRSSFVWPQSSSPIRNCRRGRQHSTQRTKMLTMLTPCGICCSGRQKNPEDAFHFSPQAGTTVLQRRGSLFSYSSILPPFTSL